MSRRNKKQKKSPAARTAVAEKKHDPDMEPDWTGKCDNCGHTPIVPKTGMCGPCTFGEADTLMGDW